MNEPQPPTPGPYPQGYPDPGHYPRPAPPSNGKGVLVLILGILGLVGCLPLGTVAWILGNSALKDIRAGRTDPGEQGIVVAGRVLGIIATCIMSLGCLFYGGLFALAILAAGVS